MTATIEQKAAAWDALVQFQRAAEHRAENGLDSGAMISGMVVGDAIEFFASRDGARGIDGKFVIQRAQFEANAADVLAKVIQIIGEKIGVPFNPADFVGPDCAGQVPS